MRKGFDVQGRDLRVWTEGQLGWQIISRRVMTLSSRSGKKKTCSNALLLPNRRRRSREKVPSKKIRAKLYIYSREHSDSRQEVGLLHRNREQAQQAFLSAQIGNQV